MESKICNICHDSKPLCEFLKPTGVGQKETKACHMCRQKALDAYYNKAEEKRAYARQYRRDNAAYFSDYLKNWKKKNRQDFNARANARYATDDLYKAVIKEQARPKRWIRCLKPNPKHEAVLGCTIELFRAHIEGLFQEGMTWANMGQHWQFDHIFPLSVAIKHGEEIFKMATHYTNVRPLLSDKNLSKVFSIPENHPITILLNSRK